MTEKKLEDINLGELVSKIVWLSINCNDDMNIASRAFDPYDSDKRRKQIGEEFDQIIKQYTQELGRREKTYLSK